ncbi:MAG: hypothetical protein JWO13_3601 [Acidobacteriales bacterium]|nr:hypothetical protein [Terriglobales bacterium]
MASTLATPFCNLEELRHQWGWFLALGVALIFLGTVALFFVPAATVATVMVLGWLMVLSGIVETVHAFRVHRWGGFFLHLIGGVLGIAIGLIVVFHPLAGALAWTLLFASFFTVIGLFRLISAARIRYRNWGWVAFDGAITLALGIMLLIGWPTSALWFLGLALGVTMILRGWSYVMASFAMRELAAGAIPQGEVRRAA